ncbi:MAG: DUF4215 domain-containing protein [Candidatus Dadabacteria bacterium]|nr:MAG: DUF4215 domain-containing protein [Candidatus Dadabacteria bacterium]
MLVSESGTQLDSGWNGLAHDTDLIEGASITFAVVRRCTTDQSVCMTDADCPGGKCELTCDCDSQNNTVCEITGPTHQSRCLVTMEPCNTNADCTSDQCVKFFGPPLPLSTAGTPACVMTYFASPLTGTADSKTGEGSASAFLRSRVHLGIDVAQPCPRCGAPSQNPKVGDQFTCEGGPNDGQPCTVDAVSPDFGGTSSDCPADPTANVSGVGLAIRMKEITTGTVSEQAKVPCGGSFAPVFPDPVLGSVCLDDGSPCMTNADCLRCTNDPTVACSTNADCGAGGTCAAAPEQPVTCGMYCHCGYCGGDIDQPCFSDADCTAPDKCVSGEPFGVLQQAAPNNCASLFCGTVNPEECCSDDTPDRCIAGQATNKTGECAQASYLVCQSDADCGPTGPCVFKNTPCFEHVIARTGTPSPLGKYCVDDPNGGACTTNADCSVGACVDDTSKPKTTALFCIPPTSSSAINTAGGIPGPGAIVFKSVVFTCRCGDGKVGCDEQCDDGNQVNGDGCDQACRIE